MGKPIIVPKLWPKSTVYIIGGGPSINDVDLSLIHDERVIGVNNAYGDPVGPSSRNRKLSAYKPRDWVDICWWGDLKWFRWHRPYLRKFQGLVMHCNENTNMEKVDWALGIRRSRSKAMGLEQSSGRICWNKCSGSSAINLAYHLGAKRIVLLGFDMRFIDGKKNYHSDHDEKVRPDPFARFLPAFKHIAKDANRLDLEIINATPDSAIKEFPITTLEDIVDGKEQRSITQLEELAESNDQGNNNYRGELQDRK